MLAAPKKVYIGFIAYNEVTAKYLPFFLPTLANQSYQDFTVTILDNSEFENNRNREFIANKFPAYEYEWNKGINSGFGKGFNILIRKAIDAGADYFLALNPDMLIEPDAVKELVAVMERNGKVGVAAPMIIKWDFANQNKTDIIDSCGIKITREHCFFDNEQGNNASSLKGSSPKEIFGFTGAAVMFRLSALPDVAFVAPASTGQISSDGPESGQDKYSANAGREKTEYFDELMFMYKEDCDLSYRLRLAGWKIILVPGAIAYHDRTAASKGESIWQIAFNRRNKSRIVKEWSLLNSYILLLKIKDLPFSLRTRIATIWYQIKSLVFILLFEQFLLKQFLVLYRIRGKIKERRKQLKVKIDIKEIESFMDR